MKWQSNSVHLLLVTLVLFLLAIGAAYWSLEQQDEAIPAFSDLSRTHQRDHIAASNQSFFKLKGVDRDDTTGSHASTELGKIRTIQGLAALGTHEALKQLASIISNLPPGDLREEAVKIASSITNPDAVPAALELLKSANDAGVIRVSQEVFARLADAGTIQAMLDIYDATNDRDLRDRLERTVAYIHSEEAVPVLLIVLADNVTPATDGMIQASAQALRQIGTPPAVDALIKRLNTEQGEEGRSMLAAQLGEVRAPTAETSLQSAALGQSKFASQTQTRISAIGTLLYYPSAETQDLLSSLAGDPNPQVSAAAIEILTEIKKRINN